MGRLPEAPFDPEALLELLDRYRIDYVLVGGYACTVHGAHRVTQDIDVVPRWQRSNLERLCSLLRAEGGRSLTGPACSGDAIIPEVLIEREVMNWTTRLGRIDTLVGIPDAEGMPVSYDQLLQRGVTVNVAGIDLAVAGLDDVITSKEFAGRRKDAEALPELRRLRDAEQVGGEGTPLG